MFCVGFSFVLFWGFFVVVFCLLVLAGVGVSVVPLFITSLLISLLTFFDILAFADFHSGNELH